MSHEGLDYPCYRAHRRHKCIEDRFNNGRDFLFEPFTNALADDWHQVGGILIEQAPSYILAPLYYSFRAFYYSSPGGADTSAYGSRGPLIPGDVLFFLHLRPASSPGYGCLAALLHCRGYLARLLLEGIG